MDFTTVTYAALGALIAGAIILFSGSKERMETGEWGSGVQWGYLLLMIGVFGVLASGFKWSFTAVLLTFTLLTGVVWLWKKIATKDKNMLDNNHFRDYLAGFFPIIAVVFVVRTFIAEPFQIPSSSMRPGLIKGDFILVNKFTYGIRIPILNTVAIEMNKIERGDVVVFNYPLQPELNYIKRIVALPGDTIEYKDKVLTVNGNIQQDTQQGTYHYPDDTKSQVIHETQRFQANFANKKFDVLKEANTPSVIAPTWNYFQMMMEQNTYESGLKQHCHYESDGSGFRCIMPEGKYFAMGDNRDASADSRYWGFVDDKLIVGKAFFIWLNIGDMKRVGTQIQ